VRQYSQTEKTCLVTLDQNNLNWKGGHKGEDRGRLDSISLEGQTRSLHANMDPPPADANFCDDSNCPMEWYNRHMGYVNSSECMANSYSINRHNFEWTIILFFHLLDLTILNRWILLPLCVAKYTHRFLRLLLVRHLIEEAGKSQDHPTPRLVRTPSAAATNVVQLMSCHYQHWPAKSCTKFCFCLCSSHGQ